MNTVDNQPEVGNLRTFSEILGLRVSNQNKFLTTKAPTLLQKNRTSSHITILVLFKVSFTSDMLIYFLNILTVIICHITHNHFVEESFLISKSVTLTNFSVKPSIYQLYSVIAVSPTTGANIDTVERSVAEFASVCLALKYGHTLQRQDGCIDKKLYLFLLTELFLVN